MCECGCSGLGQWVAGISIRLRILKVRIRSMRHARASSVAGISIRLRILKVLLIHPRGECVVCVAGISIRLRILKDVAPLCFKCSADVAGISIRLRILKVKTPETRAKMSECCRDIDPVEDTESIHKK